MKKNDPMLFVMGLAGGVILGALIDNMAIGILLGMAVGLGLVGAKRRGS